MISYALVVCLGVDGKQSCLVLITAVKHMQRRFRLSSVVSLYKSSDLLTDWYSG